MTRILYEIWPPKGSAPLISFEVEDDAIAYAKARSFAVPVLRVCKATTETARLELWRHAEKGAR